MIQNCQVERLGGPGKLAGCTAVGVARPGVAAWMVMSQHQAGAAELCCLGDDGADRYADRVRSALVPVDVEASSRVVDVGDPKLFMRMVLGAEAMREKAARGLMAIQQGRGFGTLMTHAHLLWLAPPHA